MDVNISGGEGKKSAFKTTNPRSQLQDSDDTLQVPSFLVKKIPKMSFLELILLVNSLLKYFDAEKCCFFKNFRKCHLTETFFSQHFRVSQNKSLLNSDTRAIVDIEVVKPYNNPTIILLNPLCMKSSSALFELILNNFFIRNNDSLLATCQLHFKHLYILLKLHFFQ